MVEKAKHHIREGDIFQIVLSNRLAAPFEGSLLNTYRVLRTINPSPYMFYFSGTDVEVAGASPETLVKLENGVLHTFPLAGTRPRGKTDEEDKALEKELLADEKELAEHNMLVDLGRNDLGKISRFGTVEVEKFHSIERFSHVMHIGSTVRGEIRSSDHQRALEQLSLVRRAFSDACEEAGAQLEFSEKCFLRAYRLPETAPVVQRYFRACRARGYETRTVTTFGGSDNNILLANGITGIVMPAAMHRCHSREEYTSIQEMAAVAEITADLVLGRE